MRLDAHLAALLAEHLDQALLEVSNVLVGGLVAVANRLAMLNQTTVLPANFKSGDHSACRARSPRTVREITTERVQTMS